MDDLPQLLTINQTAERLGLSHEATRRLIANGDLPVTNIARSGTAKRVLRVSVEDLQKFIRCRTHHRQSRQASPRMEARLEAARAARTQ